ncbi:MAG: methyltransferase domain-containing protein [Wenzhouxiangella sp.]
MPGPDYQAIFEQRGSRYDAAMRRYPLARQAEFEMITEPLRLAPGQKLADIPAGGGYLADYLPEHIERLSVEPATGFAAPEDNYKQKHKQARQLCCRIHQVPLGDQQLDAIISLAGLHHEPDRRRFYREAFRLLRPHGQLIIADGVVGSPVADFLNGFVDRHNPDGHQGDFLDEHDLAAIQQAGFSVDSSHTCQYPWRFPDSTAAVSFCRDLFGLACDDATLLDGLKRELNLRAEGPGWVLDWSLWRIVAHRPA